MIAPGVFPQVGATISVSLIPRVQAGPHGFVDIKVDFSPEYWWNRSSFFRVAVLCSEATYPELKIPLM
jgi:hypothetical protein